MGLLKENVHIVKKLIEIGEYDCFGNLYFYDDWICPECNKHYLIDLKIELRKEDI